MRMVNPIIEVVENPRESAGCNCCSKKKNDAWTMHEVRLGVNGHATVIRMCDVCLAELYKKIGHVIDEEGAIDA